MELNATYCLVGAAAISHLTLSSTTSTLKWMVTWEFFFLMHVGMEGATQKRAAD